MKKLTTISLFIFWAVVTAILVAGLVFSQNNNNNNQSVSGNLIQNTITQNNLTGGSMTLNMTEIAKHNRASDCWMLISGKVYNITSYFGSHPGGSSAMTSSCGKDATSAYMTKDPYATSTNGGRAHSSSAVNLLSAYYLGDLNQTINGQAVIQTNSIVAPLANGDDEYEDD